MVLKQNGFVLKFVGRTKWFVLLATSGQVLASCYLQEVLGGFFGGILEGISSIKYLSCCDNLFEFFSYIIYLLRYIFGWCARVLWHTL